MRSLRRFVVSRDLVPGFIVRRQLARELSLWNRGAGRFPNLLKHEILRGYAKNFRTLVETGTYMGATIEACVEHFDQIYSIELAEEFYLRAKRRYAKRDHVHPIRGNSADSLRALIPDLQQSTVFWLDAHPCGGLTAGVPVPVMEELDAISTFKHRHVILIDDADSFTGEASGEGYPTPAEIAGALPAYTVELKNNMFVCEQKAAASQ
jgi:hypothetical protein